MFGAVRAVDLQAVFQRVDEVRMRGVARADIRSNGHDVPGDIAERRKCVIDYGHIAAFVVAEFSVVRVQRFTHAVHETADPFHYSPRFEESHSVGAALQRLTGRELPSPVIDRVGIAVKRPAGRDLSR